MMPYVDLAHIILHINAVWIKLFILFFINLFILFKLYKLVEFSNVFLVRKIIWRLPKSVQRRQNCSWFMLWSTGMLSSILRLMMMFMLILVCVPLSTKFGEPHLVLALPCYSFCRGFIYDFTINSDYSNTSYFGFRVQPIWQWFVCWITSLCHVFDTSTWS